MTRNAIGGEDSRSKKTHFEIVREETEFRVSEMSKTKIVPGFLLAFSLSLFCRLCVCDCVSLAASPSGRLRRRC